MSSPTDGRRRLSRALLALFAALFLASCGYGFGSDGESVLEARSPGILPGMKVKTIENPTLYPWLSYVIRTELRDELAARRVARWVDSGKSDYELSVKVSNFTFRSWLTDSNDATMLYAASMTLEGIVYRSDTNEEVWRSGMLSYSQNYDRSQEQAAAAELTRELMRRLTSAFRNVF
jgi:hypothetical protein